MVVRSQTSPELLLSKGTDPSSVTPTSFRAWKRLDRGLVQRIKIHLNNYVVLKHIRELGLRAQCQIFGII